MAKWPSRNDKCPCGTGEKFKRCCLAWAEQHAADVEAMIKHRQEQIREEAEEVERQRRVLMPLRAKRVTVLEA